jgi:hypothetical protein
MPATALILGAGFSAWAAGLPVARTLFDFDVKPTQEKQTRYLARIARLKRDWDCLKPDAPAEAFIADMLTAGGAQWRLTSWYVIRRLCDPFMATLYGGHATLMIDDKRTQKLEGVRRVGEFLWLVSNARLSGIVTPNYDLLLEYALSTEGFNYGEKGEQLIGRGKNPQFPNQGAFPRLTGDFPIAKIHGSISWNADGKHTDGKCGVNGNALIVPPAPEKVCPDELRQTWDLASAILTASQRVVVFGFAFNPYDTAVLRLLAEGGANVRQVLLIDVAPQVERAKAVWPEAAVTACEPPPEGNEAILTWAKAPFEA